MRERVTPMSRPQNSKAFEPHCHDGARDAKELKFFLFNMEQ